MAPPIRIVVRRGVPARGWVWPTLRAPLASMAAHMAAILLLGSCWTSRPQPPTTGSVLEMTWPVAEAEPLSLPPVLDAAEISEDVATSSASAWAAFRPHRVSVGPLLDLSQRGAVGRRSPTSEMRGLAGLGSGSGGAGGLLASNGEGDDGAEFFGIRAGGQRFVFVVDSSRSMRGRKWTQACQELLRSVERLGPRQSFYVIFFDAEIHPMFSRRKPEPDLLPATEENFQRMKRWLPSIHFGPETWPAAAMRRSLSMSPDAIYLLSDGEFQDGTRPLLRSQNLVDDGDGQRKPRVPVHTVGFHSMACQASLLPIARENGGRFRFIPDPRARDLTQVSTR